MIRQDDSPIFNLVRSGDMDGLLSLLRAGEASLRDCDSVGTPLLHVGGYPPVPVDSVMLTFAVCD